MVGGRMLEYSDGRLCQIMGIRHSDEKAIFGNVSVLDVGDSQQLTPVGDGPVILQSTHYVYLIYVHLNNIVCSKNCYVCLYQNQFARRILL